MLFAFYNPADIVAQHPAYFKRLSPYRKGSQRIILAGVWPDQAAEKTLFLTRIGLREQFIAMDTQGRKRRVRPRKSWRAVRYIFAVCSIDWHSLALAELATFATRGEALQYLETLL